MFLFGFALLMFSRLFVATGYFIVGNLIILSGIIGASARVVLLPIFIVWALLNRWTRFAYTQIWKPHRARLNDPATAAVEPSMKALLIHMAKYLPEDILKVSKAMYRDALINLKTESVGIGRELLHDQQALTSVLLFVFGAVAFFLWIHLYWFF